MATSTRPPNQKDTRCEPTLSERDAPVRSGSELLTVMGSVLLVHGLAYGLLLLLF